MISSVHSKGSAYTSRLAGSSRALHSCCGLWRWTAGRNGLSRTSFHSGDCPESAIGANKHVRLPYVCILDVSVRIYVSVHEQSRYAIANISFWICSRRFRVHLDQFLPSTLLLSSSSFRFEAREWQHICGRSQHHSQVRIGKATSAQCSDDGDVRSVQTAWSVVANMN